VVIKQSSGLPIYQQRAQKEILEIIQVSKTRSIFFERFYLPGFNEISSPDFKSKKIRHWFFFNSGKIRAAHWLIFKK
jgi:hypothetical protein